MRIAHVLRTLDPAAGGPPMVATRLATAQVQLGHTVTLVADGNPAQLPSEWFPRVSGPAPIVAPSPPDLRSIVMNSDALHLHGVWDSILYRAAAHAHRRGIPYVVTPHGMLDPWSMAQKRWKKRLALALGYRRMLNRAAALHLLNTDEQRLIEPLGILTPTVVVPNGVFLEEIDRLPFSDEFRARYKTLADHPYVLFIGRLHYKKGLDYLADAFHRLAARLPRARLVVAGPDDGARGDFERRIHSLNVSNSVIMTGPLFGALKWGALSGAACFCLPSRQEGFSVAILEALACGVPAVVSEECHFPEISTAGAGCVVPLDPVRIADGLMQFLQDAEVGRRAGAAGRRLVEDRFTWPKIAADSIRLYQRPAVAGAGIAEG